MSARHYSGSTGAVETLANAGKVRIYRPRERRHFIVWPWDVRTGDQVVRP